MIEIPNMVMIGGNSRNAGKTTLACKIINKLASLNEVFALKVTSIRPGETDFHGHHQQEHFLGFDIIEELNSDTHKDTSMMLKAGASRVFYVRASDGFVEQAVRQFLEKHNNDQPIICESRSLREIIKPGLFLMMMRLPAAGTDKDVSSYLSSADTVFYYGEDHTPIDQFVANLCFGNGKFIQGNAI